MDVAKCTADAAARVGHRVNAVVEEVEPLLGNRWKAVVGSPARGRVSVSFDVEPGADAETVIVRAGLEIQEYLKLCPLCLGPAYVQRADAHATQVYFECEECERFSADGQDVTDLRKARVRKSAESERAVEALRAWTRAAAKAGEAPPFIGNWRADADDYRRRWMQ